MTKHSKIFIGFCILTLTACNGGGQYKSYYKPNSEHIPMERAYTLKDEGEPRLVFSENFKDDLKIFTDQNYMIVGQSEFSGPVEDLVDVQNFGATLGVTHILLSANFSYSASKRAYKFVRNDTIIPTTVLDAKHPGHYKTEYDRVYDNIAIPYRKEIPIFKQRAAFLIQLK